MPPARFVSLAAVLVLTATTLTTGVAGASAHDEPAERLLVSYLPGATPAEVAATEADAGAALLRTIPQLGVRVLEVPGHRAAGAAEALARNPNVLYAEPDGRGQAALVPSDPLWADQWGAARIGASTAWDRTTGASEVTVALLDSGVNASHPDLAGRVLPGYDFVNDDSDPADDQGHGTSVTGVAAATGDNAIGVAGMCWRCAILPVKVLDANNWATWSDLASGIVWAVDSGAQVLSISIIGSTGGSTLESAVRYAHDRGVLVVAAAGNNGTTTPGYPAAFDEVLAVAASTSGDGRYSWSSYGPWVDVAAPGCNPTTTRSGSYASFCGTSSSTPLVAGVAALLRSVAPAAQAADLRSAITSTAVPVGDWVAHGRVDAPAAIAALLGSAPSDPQPPEPEPSPAPEPAPPPETVTSTFSGSLNGKFGSRDYSLDVGTGELSATLAFTKDPTLSVTLLDPSGTPVGQSQGASPVSLGASVSPGEWILRVSGGKRASFTLTVTAPSP